ncbi:MAG: hypothetical protein QM831_18980 [Kofleriaceae bacterium]
MRLATTLLCLCVSATAYAQSAALDDGKPAQPNAQPGQPAEAKSEEATKPEDLVEYGIDLRLRSVHVPQALLQLFVDKAADGASNIGYGIDFVRRKGNLELQLGIEHEQVTVGEGVWINKGDNVAAGDEADYVLGPDHSSDGGLGWYTIEFTFINHVPINKYVSFRYGGGAGLGILTGALTHYNVICNGATNDMPSPGCVPTTLGGTGTDSDGHGFTQPVKYDLPPVFPVINGIIGFQFKPIDNLVINLEGGIRTLPFFGISVGYFIH